MTRLISPRWLAVGAAAAALAALSAPGMARADTPVTTTIHETLPVDTAPVEVGCPGSPANPYVETVSESGLGHITAFSDDSGTVKIQLKADVVAVPASDPSLPTYTAHAVLNLNAHVASGQTATVLVTESAVLSGSDGTHANAHIVERVTVDLQGITGVAFDHSNENIVC